MTWCKHYRAMSDHDTCKAGVAYKTVHVGTTFMYPCFEPALQNCPLQDWPTPEERAAEEEQVNLMIQQFFTDLASDVCPHCHTPIERKKQVGRCVYAEPCGCRLYQGKLK